MQNYCAEVKIRAERRAEELLLGMEKGKGGHPSKTADMMSGVSEYRAALKTSDINERAAERYQIIANTVFK
jgi:hypothetical protein